MSFVKFTAYGAASRDLITIRTNQLLFVSKLTLKEFNEKAKFVVIHIDEEKKLIGLEFIETQPRDTSYRRLTFEKAGVSMNIAPVLRFFLIKKITKKIILDYEKIKDMLVFSLDGIQQHITTKRL